MSILRRKQKIMYRKFTIINLMWEGNGGTFVPGVKRKFFDFDSGM